ncbi:recombinase family protein [Corynebacterium freneyi]|uniref:recombinase family protein n=1 Tax=Corynebacterium freneyi TaxID=134034 RepID=UPI002551204F|nr:recombinase family protein [Corynebacterium freneyi]MDK8768946.1 recombinase family protein [Corynebacterium freneyi]
MTHTTSAVQPPPGQRVAYLRVSSAGQNVARQREAVGAVDAEFIDHVSGSTRSDRTELARAMDYLRAGDTLIVASIDRLARSTRDLHHIVEEIQAKGAGVEFVKESLHFSPGGGTDPRDQLMLTVMGAIAAFERDLIRERQAEGIAAAKARGAYRGAPRAMTAEMVTEARRRIAAGETKAAVARDLKIGRATLYRYLRAHQADPAGRA